MKRKLVYVQWNDASFDNRSLLVSQLEDFEPLTVVETAGILVRETDEFIMLAIDWMPGYSKWRSITSIPKVNVIKKKVISIDV